MKEKGRRKKDHSYEYTYIHAHKSSKAYAIAHYPLTDAQPVSKQQWAT